jgi:hypothetical protein
MTLARLPAGRKSLGFGSPFVAAQYNPAQYTAQVKGKNRYARSIGQQNLIPFHVQVKLVHIAQLKKKKKMLISMGNEMGYNSIELAPTRMYLFFFSSRLSKGLNSSQLPSSSSSSLLSNPPLQHRASLHPLPL